MGALLEVLDAGVAEAEPEPVLVPPPPPAPDGGGEQIASINVVGGVITCYPERGEFYAACTAVGHRRCVLVRTKNGRANKPCQGRPLGHLMSFLADGSNHRDKVAHKHFFVETFANRCAGRRALELIPNSNILFDFERPRRPDEGLEPDFAP